MALSPQVIHLLGLDLVEKVGDLARVGEIAVVEEEAGVGVVKVLPGHLRLLQGPKPDLNNLPCGARAFPPSLSSHGHHITSSDIDRGALPEEADANKQPRPWALSDQNPAETSQRTTNDFNRLPRFQGRVGVHRQDAGYQTADCLDLFEGDRHRLARDPKDFNYSRSHLHLPVVTSAASDEAIAGEKRELDMDAPVLPLANPVNQGEKDLEAASLQISRDHLLMPGSRP